MRNAECGVARNADKIAAWAMRVRETSPLASGPALKARWILRTARARELASQTVRG
jgi:hypothetical protein